MKTFTSAILMLGLFASTVVSCKKDDSTKINEEEDLKSTKMTYKIDGSPKTSTYLFAVKDEETIYIYGSIGDSESVVLSIDNFNGKGDYNVDGENSVIAYTSGTNSYLSEEGTIKITSSTDNEVKGTFTGKLQNFSEEVSKEITEGKFEAKIVDKDLAD